MGASQKAKAHHKMDGKIDPNYSAAAVIGGQGMEFVGTKLHKSGHCENDISQIFKKAEKN